MTTRKTSTKSNRITLRQIDGEIATFVQSRDALRQHAHNIAMMMLYHCAPEAVSDDCQGSGDCTRFTKLCRAMPASWAEQMIAWAAAFTPITIVLRESGDSVGFNLDYKKLAPADKPGKWNLEGAASTPFWEFQKERAPEMPKTFEDLLKMVEQLGKRIDKMAKEGKIEDNDLASAESMAAKLTTLKFQRVKATNDDDTKSKSETPKKRSNAKAAAHA